MYACAYEKKPRHLEPIEKFTTYDFDTRTPSMW